MVRPREPDWVKGSLHAPVAGDSMEIEPNVVESVARQVIGVGDATLQAWEVESIGGGASGEIGLTAGVQRVRGVATTRDGAVDWSVIVKVLTNAPINVGSLAAPPRDDPHTIQYWRREAEAYRSDLLLPSDAGLVVPRCWRIDEAADAEIVLWLEDLPDAGPHVWSQERLALAAYHLGQFNGIHLGSENVVARPWLTRGRVEGWVAEAVPWIGRIRHHRRDGFEMRWLSDRSVDRLEAQWERRDELMSVLGRSPVTLCHHDAHRRNLGSMDDAGRVRTIGYDWQYLGTGHLGEEIAALVAVTLQFLDVPMSDAPSFEALTLEAYVEGLRDAGWRGDPGLVRAGYPSAAALILGLGGTGVWFAILDDERNEGMLERIVGQPLDSIAEQWAAMQPFLLDLGEEALGAA